MCCSLINQTLVTLKKEGKNDDYLTYIKRISPVAWVNINLTGRYQFKSYAGDIGFNDSVSKLKEYFYNEMLRQTPLYHT